MEVNYYEYSNIGRLACFCFWSRNITCYFKKFFIEKKMKILII